MSDLIERQAALNAITDELMPSTPLSAVIRAKNRLKDLPAVQPDHTADIGKKVFISCGHENDVISRQMAIDTIMGQPPEPHYPSWYAAQIEKLPAAQPEIIRCKDCKYGAPNGRYGCTAYHYRKYETHDMKPDDFCSRAERRTDG